MMLSKVTFIALLLISTLAMHTFATPAPADERIDERIDKRGGKYIEIVLHFKNIKLLS